MTLRFKSFRLYFRLWFCALPVLAFLLAAYARFYDFRLDPLPLGHDNRFYVVVCILATLVWAIAAEHNRLLDIDELFKENTGLRRTLAAVGSTYLTLVCVLFFYRQQNISRLFFAISAGLLFVTTVASRVCFRSLLRGRYQKRPVRVLIVGADAYAIKVAERMAKIPLTPSEVVAHVALPDQKPNAKVSKVVHLEDPDSWVYLGFDEIVIALPPSRLDMLSELVEQLETLRVPIRTVLDVGNTPIVRDRLFQLGDLQFLDLATTPIESAAYFVVKRIFDLAFSIAAVILTAPLMLIIASAIKATSHGPVLFRQVRVGLNGEHFTMYKFRTMQQSCQKDSDTKWTTANDDRRTPIGALLRRTSLDELPQFFNVLKGDMSVVGPRPERPHFVKRFLGEIAHYNCRHRLKVGITGWAQVNGWRGDTAIQKRLELDLYYLQNWSFWFDVRIILLTAWSGMFGRNAY